MKKTLLALALLLGTVGAFAQIGIKADAIQEERNEACASDYASDLWNTSMLFAFWN